MKLSNKSNHDNQKYLHCTTKPYQQAAAKNRANHCFVLYQPVSEVLWYSADIFFGCQLVMVTFEDVRLSGVLKVTMTTLKKFSLYHTS